MPSKHDIDPNAIMSIFYYAFFGMMFSDAGYGLLMMLVCGFMGFIARVEDKTKNFMRMFFYCGVSTFIWGLLFGGFLRPVVRQLDMRIRLDRVRFHPFQAMGAECLSVFRVFSALHTRHIPASCFQRDSNTTPIYYFILYNTFLRS